MTKGKIFYEPWIDCGICNTSEPLTPSPGQSNMGFAREIGWKRTRKYGWICPRCKEFNYARAE